MSEFAGEKSKYQAHCEQAVAPLDLETAVILADYLEHMVESIGENCQSNVDEEKFSQGIVVEGLLESPSPEGALSEISMTLTHMIYHTDPRNETYDLTLSWRALRDDLIDPGYTRQIHLMIPRSAEEAPQLLIFYKKSAIATQIANGEKRADEPVLNDPGSAHMLNKAFYFSQKQGIVAAEQLFDELAEISALAAAQLSE